MGESVIIETIRALAPEGVFALLFVILFFYTMNRQDKREKKLQTNETLLIEKQEKREKELVERHEQREAKLMIFLESTNNGHDKLMQNQGTVVEGLKEVASIQRETVTCLGKLDGKLEAIIMVSKNNSEKRRLSKK
ncbi:MAG: hypothetical protein DDT42_01509 [candidate division WS2 bacterium]|uniref:Uncharacterized protein n=1 Tax=Psychracetigena formicireducens TaxID=2986056 RepID=A0A9E2F6S3_PSYF1|nr:hypothetical protein [Candidatus Psychracetigena formicireducens]